MNTSSQSLKDLLLSLNQLEDEIDSKIKIKEALNSRLDENIYILERAFVEKKAKLTAEKTRNQLTEEYQAALNQYNSEYQEKKNLKQRLVSQSGKQRQSLRDALGSSEEHAVAPPLPTNIEEEPQEVLNIDEKLEHILSLAKLVRTSSPSSTASVPSVPSLPPPSTTAQKKLSNNPGSSKIRLGLGIPSTYTKKASIPTQKPPVSKLTSAKTASSPAKEESRLRDPPAPSNVLHTTPAPQPSMSLSIPYNPPPPPVLPPVPSTDFYDILQSQLQFFNHYRVLNKLRAVAVPERTLDLQNRITASLKHLLQYISHNDQVNGLLPYFDINSNLYHTVRNLALPCLKFNPPFIFNQPLTNSAEGGDTTFNKADRLGSIIQLILVHSAHLSVTNKEMKKFETFNEYTQNLLFKNFFRKKGLFPKKKNRSADPNFYTYYLVYQWLASYLWLEFYKECLKEILYLNDAPEASIASPSPFSSPLSAKNPAPQSKPVPKLNFLLIYAHLSKPMDSPDISILFKNYTDTSSHEDFLLNIRLWVSEYKKIINESYSHFRTSTYYVLEKNLSSVLIPSIYSKLRRLAQAKEHSSSKWKEQLHEFKIISALLQNQARSEKNLHFYKKK